jgi:hypothetical protein
VGFRYTADELAADWRQPEPHERDQRGDLGLPRRAALYVGRECGGASGSPAILAGLARFRAGSEFLHAPVLARKAKSRTLR